MDAKNFFKIVAIALVVLAAVIIIVERIEDRLGDFGYTDSDYYYDEYSYSNESIYSDSSCNVAGVILHGDLYTYYDSDSKLEDDAASAEDIVYFLELAEDAPNIDVILLEIDSYGGSPVAAKEVTDTLEQYVTKPVVAQIREGGASAAYWVASASDHVFAAPHSVVGSIGVTMSYVDSGLLNEKEGYTYNQISSGRFKDAGSYEKLLTEEERAMFQRDVDTIHRDFVMAVAQNRNMSVDDVEALADGSAMLGSAAKTRGLVDSIGSAYDTRDFIGAAYGIDPVVCW